MIKASQMKKRVERKKQQHLDMWTDFIKCLLCGGMQLKVIAANYAQGMLFITLFIFAEDLPKQLQNFN